MKVRSRLSRQSVLVTSLLLFFGVVNAAWLYLDHSIPAWDDAYYLTNSLRTFDALTGDGLSGLSRQFLHGMSTKPPLIATLPIPAYLIWGRDPRGALLVNLACLMITLGATYLLAGALADRKAALIAVCIAGSMPMIYGLSRVYLVECGLTAFVTLALYVLARADTEGWWAAGVLGTICGLGLLLKTSFPVYVAAPMVWSLVRRGRATVTRGRIAAFLIPIFVIAGPWYAVNSSAALRTALAAGSAETAQVYGTGGLAETGAYLVNLMNCGPRLYFLALPLLALLAMGRLKAYGRGLIFCAVAALPLTFLAVSHYRDLRYAAPLFPVIAVALGILATASISRFPKGASIAIVFLLVVGTADMLSASFGAASRRFEGGGLLFSAARFSYIRPPQLTPSPYPDLLTAIERRGRWKAGIPHRLILGSDTMMLNADNVTLAALAARIPIGIATTAYTPEAVLPQLLGFASYFAYVDSAADSPFNSSGRAAVSLVNSDPHFREILSATLPDHSLMHVLEAAESSVPPVEDVRIAQRGDPADGIPDCAVRFGDGIELTGLWLHAVPDGIEVRYRWRGWKRMSRDYWSFGHILDDQGKVLGYLDHAIRPEKPTSRWEVDETAIERITVRVTTGGNALPQAVRLGVFDRQSGDRQPILSSVFPLADGGTSTVAPVH